jgi:hypothetical protein
MNTTMLMEVRRHPDWARGKEHGLVAHRALVHAHNRNPEMNEAMKDFLALTTRTKSDSATWVILSPTEATVGKKVIPYGF